MKTLRLSASGEDIARAAELIRGGELVAFPTETVYGLGARGDREDAVRKIFAAKGRPSDNPLILHIASFGALLPLCSRVPPAARTLADAFWPGPLTMVLPRSERVPGAVSAGLPTVAVRFPAHRAARQLIAAAGVPIAAPSANLSGSPSPTEARRVLADMDGRIAAVIDGGSCEVGVESTVITLCDDIPRVLRPGGITVPMLREVLGEVRVDPAVTAPLAPGQTASSPGMKYRHYAPKADVIAVRGSAERFARYVNARAGEGVMALCFTGEEQNLAVPVILFGERGDPRQQARRLFEALREADDKGCRTLYVACPREDGLGLAVVNRLMRAAGFHEEEA